MKNPKAIGIALCLLFATSLSAQSNVEQKRESIRAQKVGYLTTQVGLTSKEAERFWPIYNERENALESLKKERRRNRKAYRDGVEASSEADLEKLLDKEIELRGKEHEIIVKYHSIFKQKIGVKKTAKLYRAESQFNAKLVKGVRDKAMRNRGGTRPNGRAE